MKRYFKRDGESLLGPGTIWMEFDDDWPSRQVEFYSGQYFSSREDYHQSIGPGLADQPLNVLGLGPDQEITPDEFEEVWRASEPRGLSPPHGH